LISKNTSNDNLIAEFFKLESAGGLMLIAASVLAIIFANTGFYGIYEAFLHMKITVLIGNVGFDKSLLHWVNDGLMAIFFFIVGLEIKREFLKGTLSSKESLVLPFAAAIGGMAIPALVYYYIAKDTPELIDGWAIPAATDIAFALGILGLLGSRIPISLKALLTAIAVIDDIGAVIIIALFYTADLSTSALIMSAICVAGLFTLNKMKCTRTAAYIMIGFILWASVLKSGVHATLAGVITALFIPLDVKNEDGHSIAHHLEHSLHPWVAYAILPLFAFANAGVSFEGITLEKFTSPVTLGIFCGLFLGKQFGIFASIFTVIKLGLTKMPKDMGWAHLYGLSALCGIGFTMSLFIGTLAFSTPGMESSVRLGVIVGSLMSALLGSAILYTVSKKKK
jgi:NhaA family Na+:H+ antiporter